MCGRFTMTLDALELQKELELGEMPVDWLPRFNIAPSQPVAVVTEPNKREVSWMRWGLIPSWAKDIRIGSQMINARAETLEVRPAFRRAYAQRRCLILADGFYEWKRNSGKKAPATPYHFYLNGRKPFTFAGLWESWKSPNDEEIRSCAIVTCAANSVVGAVHERMPVILGREDCWKWLEPRSAPELAKLLQPYSGEDLRLHPVSRLVNRPEFDHPDCILPQAE